MQLRLSALVKKKHVFRVGLFLANVQNKGSRTSSLKHREIETISRDHGFPPRETPQAATGAFSTY